ncbi:MAG: 30S ribosomal protein S20 [bacterium]|jgi:small subunit ribosomal protein S20
MPNIKQAGKRARQALVRRVRNRSTKSEIATARRVFVDGIESKDKAKALKEFSAFCSILDKSVKRGIVKKNAADRRKARASAALAKMA